jgi:hypothetical protein
MTQEKIHRDTLKRGLLIAAAFAVVKLLVHFFTSTNYDPHRDTYLYYSIGAHLDWGYVSVPPFIGWIARLSTILFNSSEFGLNFFPALVGAASIIIIALAVMEFGGGTVAVFIACLAFLVSPSFLRSNSFLQPVSFDQFFWLLSAYFIIKILKTHQLKYWIYIFLIWAIGFLNKYLIAAYASSFLIALLFTKERKLIFTKQFLIGAVTGILTISPNIIWQYNHNWPVLNHLKELHDNQLVNVSSLGFIIDQLAMNYPGLFVWGFGLILFISRKTERKFITVSLASLLAILILLLSHGKSYYTLGLYPILFAAGGYLIEKYGSIGFRRFAIYFTIISAIPLIPFSLPILNFNHLESYTSIFGGLTNRWEDGKVHNIPQDYADMTGWRELGQEVAKTYQSLSPEEKRNCAIYAENYGQAGAINFFGKSYGLPEAISFNDNFLLWAPDSVNKPNLIYVNNEIGDIKFLFKSYILVYEVKNKYFRENGLQVYYCTQPVDSFQSFYSKKAMWLKSKYERKVTF